MSMMFSMLASMSCLVVYFVSYQFHMSVGFNNVISNVSRYIFNVLL